jgi:hypothetical protein
VTLTARRDIKVCCAHQAMANLMYDESGSRVTRLEHGDTAFGFYYIGWPDSFFSDRQCEEKIEALVNDVRKCFTEKIPLQALLLSGFGSSSDSPKAFFSDELKMRRPLKRSHLFYADVKNLKDFLRAVLAEAGIFGIDVACVNSYAVLWRNEDLKLLSHNLLHPHTQLQGRLAQVVRFEHLRTGVEVGVANCVAFATRSQPLTNAERRNLFEGIAVRLGAVKGQQTNCYWVIGGNIEASEGLLTSLASEYKADGTDWGPALTQSHNIAPECGDFAVSQGLDLIHMESTVGARSAAKDRVLAASTSHNLVIVQGFLQSLVASPIGSGNDRNSSAPQPAVASSSCSDKVLITCDSTGKVTNKEYCLHVAKNHNQPKPLYLSGYSLLGLLDTWLSHPLYR